MTYDNKMKFTTHIDNINTKAKTRLNVLRALTNTTFGQSKEDITLVHKQYIRPILTYGQPAWQPHTATTDAGLGECCRGRRGARCPVGAAPGGALG